MNLSAPYRLKGDNAALFSERLTADPNIEYVKNELANVRLASLAWRRCIDYEKGSCCIEVPGHIEGEYFFVKSDERVNSSSAQKKGDWEKAASVEKIGTKTRITWRKPLGLSFTNPQIAPIAIQKGIRVGKVQIGNDTVDPDSPDCLMGAHAIGLAFCEDVIIEDSLIQAVGGSGIRLRHCKNVRIRGVDFNRLPYGYGPTGSIDTQKRYPLEPGGASSNIVMEGGQSWWTRHAFTTGEVSTDPLEAYGHFREFTVIGHECFEPADDGGDTHGPGEDVAFIDVTVRNVKRRYGTEDQKSFGFQIRNQKTLLLRCKVFGSPSDSIRVHPGAQATILDCEVDGRVEVHGLPELRSLIKNLKCRELVASEYVDRPAITPL